MELITILNRCHRLQGFVYQHAHFSADKKSIEVAVRPRKGSAAVCSRCHLPTPGYDQLAERRFEFIPLWGFLVFLLYTMRRVNCRRCGIVAVEEVPWGDGKRTLTRAYMLFLARWARKLSWKETAESFPTSWEKVFDAVEHVVTFGLEHRVLGQIDAIALRDAGLWLLDLGHLIFAAVCAIYLTSHFGVRVALVGSLFAIALGPLINRLTWVSFAPRMPHEFIALSAFIF